VDKITSITHSRRDQSFAPSGFLGGTRVVGGACTARVCTPRRPPRLVAIVVVAIVVVVIVVAIPRRRAIRDASGARGRGRRGCGCGIGHLEGVIDGS
jgi:hypothetical protein